jgi:hypothetical protein
MVPKLLTKSISILSYIVRLYTIHHIPFLSAHKTASREVRPKTTLGTKLHTLRPAMQHCNFVQEPTPLVLKNAIQKITSYSKL